MQRILYKIPVYLLPLSAEFIQRVRMDMGLSASDDLTFTNQGEPYQCQRNDVDNTPATVQEVWAETTKPHTP